MLLKTIENWKWIGVQWHNVVKICPPLLSTADFFQAKISLAFKCYTAEKKEESELISQFP